MYQTVLNTNLDISNDFCRMVQENLARHKNKIDKMEMEEGSDTS